MLFRSNFYEKLTSSKNDAEGASGPPTKEQIVDYKTMKIYQDFMSLIRDKDDRARNGSRVGKYDNYLTGLARAGLGWGELQTKKNPFNDENLPPELKSALLKEVREMVDVAYHGVNKPKSGHNGKSFEETMDNYSTNVESYRKFLEQNKDSVLVKQAKSMASEKEDQKFMEDRRKRLGKLLR